KKKRVKDSQYFNDKMLLMEAMEKGTVLDAEAEAFLADVECTAPYDQPLAITTTSMFKERKSKKRTKNKAKTTKPNSEWKSKEKTKSKSKPKPEKSTQKLRGKEEKVQTANMAKIYSKGHSCQVQRLLTAKDLQLSWLTCPLQVEPMVQTTVKSMRVNTDAIKSLYVNHLVDHMRLHRIEHHQARWGYVGIDDNTIQLAISTNWTAKFKDIPTELKEQLQGKDDTIWKLQTLINSISMLNVGPTVENINVKRRYQELLKSNTHSRDALTGKITALTTENAKLKTELISKISSGPIASDKPKVLALGMYAISPKYIPPQRRVNRAVHTPLPKKQQVTFQEPPRPSNRPTQKTVVQQNKKPNVLVNLSTRTKPATESRKPMPKSHTRNHRILPSKSVNARRAADHNRKLNVVDHNQFVIRSLKSVNTKNPPG
ncbi:hypothetical protein Tco_1043397, partial [Tanacetum coccineum]